MKKLHTRQKRKFGIRHNLNGRSVLQDLKKKVAKITPKRDPVKV